MLVEDDPADAELAELSVRQATVANEVHRVPDAEAALSFLHRTCGFEATPQPDMVLVDLNLPGSDGHDLLTAIRSDPELAHLPVIVLTTSDEAQDVREAYRRGANAFLVKPVDFSSFQDVMNRFLELWFELIRLPDPG